MISPGQPGDPDSRTDDDSVIEAQARRIRQLEQALDQAMLYLEDLRQRVQQRQDLEAQLEIVQEYTYVQERAITTLKARLASVQAGPSQPQPEDSPAAEGGSRDRDTARWRQQAMELQSQCALYQSRCSALESQVADLQEQILRQAKQASEYETAVHFWKTRCSLSQQQIEALAHDLESEVTQLSDQDAAPFQPLLQTLRHAADSPADDAFPCPELPDFLIRRQYYRNRQLLRDSRFS